MRADCLKVVTFTTLFLASVLPNLFAAHVTISFDEPLQLRDGFGVNYVETSRTRDYGEWPENHGGLSTLTEEQRQEMHTAVFGQDGLRPGIVKMFIDPLQKEMYKSGNDNNDPMKIDVPGYSHARTTEWMRYFVREGL